MTGRLEGRVALVTGAASGIGAACATRFSAEGARVVGLDLEKPDASPTVGFQQADVRDEAAVARALGQVVETEGRLDVVVNAAGVAGGGPAHVLEMEEWDRILDINLKGTVLVCKHALGHMIERGAGNIVNLASVEGLVGLGGALPYNAAKGGVVLATRNMAIDYGPLGIRVNCLCPGFIRTPMTAIMQEGGELEFAGKHVANLHMLGRIGEPEEVAAAALFLASDDASFVTGHALVVDGGMTAGHRFFAAEAMVEPGTP